MAWTLPTLGWGVLDWMASYLPSPRDPALPLVLTDEQAEFVLAWYSVDQAGHFPYRRSICERAKGWGKSPLHGAIALAELGAADPDDSAPVLFDGWRGREPVGRPWGVKGAPRPWVQLGAVSEDQADNTYSALYEMLTANEHRAARALGIDDGRTRLYLTRRPGSLEPVTASAGSREGQPVTHALLDETHLWTRRNGGVKLAATLRRNVAKMGGRTQETTNAPVLGEGSVAEQSGQAVARGFSGILWDAVRPDPTPEPDWSDDQLLAALRVAYGDAAWVDLRRILADVRDPATDWSDALRFFFNTRSAAARSAVDPRRWEHLGRDPRDVPAGTLVGLGFDGSVSRDCTALVACMRDGYSWPVRIWERPPGAPEDWRIPRLEVRDAVEGAFERYTVGLMLCDPPRWSTEIEEWAQRWGADRVLAFDTNQPRRMAPAVDRWLTAIREGSHTHSGDEALGRHVRAARLHKVRATADDSDGRSMYVLVKGDEKAWIDGAIADVLAFQAAMTMEEPPVRQPRLGAILV